MNKVIVLGTVDRDPETRHTQNGTLVSNFTVKSVESWEDKNGEKKERLTFVRCCAFGNVSKIVDRYVRAGKQVFIEGRLDISSTGEGTDKRIYTKVCVVSLELLGEKDENPNYFPPATNPEPKQTSILDRDYKIPETTNFDPNEVPF